MGRIWGLVGEVKIQKFEIEAKLPGLNDMIKRNRANKYQGAQDKRMWQNVCITFMKAHHLKKIENSAALIFEWHEKTRRRDKDNVARAKKYILDRLQVGGYLKNDNNKYISGFVDRFVYDGQQKVVITILESDTEEE